MSGLRTSPLVESNHARTTCANGHPVKTVQVAGRGPAFFPATCPKCSAEVPWRATFNDE